MVGAIAYPLGTRHGETREVMGKPSMQKGMMDGDGRVAPTDDNGCQPANTGMHVPVFLIRAGIST